MLPDSTLIGIIIVVVAAIIFIRAAIQIVPQGFNWTVERFGRYNGTLHPGFNLIIPFADRIGRRINMMEQVLDIPPQEVISRDNANVSNSPSAKMLQIASAASKAYYLTRLIPEHMSQAHLRGDIHIHDLSMLTGYCAGWSLKQLIQEGLGGVPGKITSGPANHLST